MADPNQDDARVKLVESLWADPEARADIEKHTKRIHPKASIPSLELREEREKAIADLRAEREAFAADRRKDQQERARDQARQALVRNPKLGVAEEDIPAIEKLMEDELIGSHDAAAEVYAARRSVAGDTHRPFSPNMDVPGVRGAGGDEFKGILEDRDNWARNKAAEVLNEFNHGRR